jgi:hypothetical protein
LLPNTGVQVEGVVRDRQGKPVEAFDGQGFTFDYALHMARAWETMHGFNYSAYVVQLFDLP